MFFGSEWIQTCDQKKQYLPSACFVSASKLPNMSTACSLTLTDSSWFESDGLLTENKRIKQMYHTRKQIDDEADDFFMSISNADYAKVVSPDWQIFRQ